MMTNREMNQHSIKVDDAVRVKGYEGVAFRIYKVGPIYDEGEETIWDYWDSELDEYPFKEILSDSQVIAIMVGDDHEWTFDINDVEVIDEDSYCGGCGQIGCGWG